MSKSQELSESIKKLARSGGGMYRRIIEEEMKRTPEERVRAWDETVKRIKAIRNSEEDWDTVLRNLGVDPVTGRGLES